MPSAEETTTIAHAAAAPAATMKPPTSTQQHSREDLALAEQLSMLHKSSSETRHFSGLEALQDATPPRGDGASTESIAPGEKRRGGETDQRHSLENSQSLQIQQHDQTAPSPNSGGEGSTPQPQRSHVSTAPITGQICR